jgi:hypothetical protein
MVPFPPATPFTVHVADVFPAPLTVATNCLVCRTRTEALAGEMVMLTGTAPVMLTKAVAVFDGSAAAVALTLT